MTSIPALARIAREFRILVGLPHPAEPNIDPRDDVDPVSVPTESQTKAQIISWLMTVGVGIDEPALSKLTKYELLDLVSDVVNGDVDSALVPA